jgi:hypothetical protein
MGLDKRQRAEKKAAKLQKKREFRRTEKEWLRNQTGYQGCQQWYLESKKDEHGTE